MVNIDKKWVEKHIDDNGQVTIPEGVEIIEAGAFKDNQVVKKVIMPDSIYKVGSQAFAECSSLKEIKFSKNIKNIGEDAFYKCEQLTAIELPKSIEQIGEEAFACCVGLKKFLIDQEAKISEIQDTTFYQCRNLSEMELPDTIENIGEYAFVECDSLNESIFSSLSQLATIKEGAFMQCKSLKNINIPDSVNSIQKAAFYQCSGLKNVEFSKKSKVKKVGEQAFQMCEKLRKVQLPENCEEIGKLAFSGCKNLAHTEFGNKIKIIGERAFVGCESLQSISMPDLLKEISLGAFYKCTGLQEINLGDGIETIGRGAFSNCERLKSISLPKNLKKIGAAAFINCSALTNIEGGENVEQIEPGAFENVKIKAFKVPPKVRNIDNILVDCKDLEEMYLGENTEQIISMALKGCTNLKKIVINDKLKYLPEMILEDCNKIKEVQIDGNQRIHYNSFKGRESIRNITIDGKKFSLDENEQLYSLQRYRQNVAIVVKDDDGALRTRCINLDKGTDVKKNINIYLANDGSIVRSINSIADMSLEQLNTIKTQGEKKLHLCGAIRDMKPAEIENNLEYDLYDIDDLIHAKRKIQELKKKVIIPSIDDSNRQKKIYSQIISNLSKELKYDYIGEYFTCKTDEERENEKLKYEKIEGKSWGDYFAENRERNVLETMLEDGNLIGYIKGKAVCRGNVEIIRNIAAEFGINTTTIIGRRHTWNQVLVDGTWYDDDFTMYSSYLSKGILDKSCKRFLCGQTNGESSFSKIKVYSNVYNHSNTVGNDLSVEDKKILLNYGMVHEVEGEMAHGDGSNEQEN